MSEYASLRFRALIFSAAAFTLALAAPAQAQNSYSVAKLDSNIPNLAAHTDPNLVNPWGLAAFPGNPWWVSDNGTGLSTLYDDVGTVESLVVTIPPSASNPTATGTPTGILANLTSSFGGAAFVFCTEDGTISTWAGAPSASIVVDKGATAVYKGITVAQMGSADAIYAANFRAGTVEVYDTNFNPITLPTGAFTDSNLPAGYAPFNVQAMNGSIYVAFAEQDSAKHDEIDGPGLGYVDQFDTSGNLMLRFAHGTYLNAPWGLAISPAGFGQFSGDLLVGNFGSGTILAFDPVSGKALGALHNAASGRPLTAAGLWAIAFGLGGSTGSTTSLFFTAGGKNEGNGVFGSISVAP